MSVNLKIGINNNLTTNSSYTNFLGVTMDNTLSWNNHIDLLMKKLSTACYIIRNAKTYVCLVIKNDLSCFLSAMSYRVIFWGNLSHSSTIFSMQRKAIGIME